MQFKSGSLSNASNYPSWKTNFDKANYMLQALTPVVCWTYTCVFFSRCFHILVMKKTVRSVVCQCTTCRRHSTKPQMLGQLPPEQTTPGIDFEQVGVDYASPLQIKYGMEHKPVIVKSYICFCLAEHEGCPLRSRFRLDK